MPVELVIFLCALSYVAGFLTRQAFIAHPGTQPAWLLRSLDRLAVRLGLT